VASGTNEPGSGKPEVREIDTWEDEGGAEADGTARMSFLEHLEELRKRLVYSLYALLVGCGISFFFAVRLTHYLQSYLTAQGGRLIYTELTGGFMFYFKVGALSGVMLAAPAMFWQLWMFVAPGLYQKEKRIVVPFVLSATTLFASGVAFAHKVAIPSMLKFFASFENPYIDMRPNASDAFNFYVLMVFAFGIVFQMPILVYFLARFGIVTAGWMWKNFRYAILIIFIIAAIATPSADPVNQTIFAAPMIILYLISIAVAWMFQKKTKEAV
jgi:sec-independent protein translocase protein TatC